MHSEPSSAVTCAAEPLPAHGDESFTESGTQRVLA